MELPPSCARDPCVPSTRNRANRSGRWHGTECKEEASDRKRAANREEDERAEDGTGEYDRPRTRGGRRRKVYGKVCGGGGGGGGEDRTKWRTKREREIEREEVKEAEAEEEELEGERDERMRKEAEEEAEETRVVVGANRTRYRGIGRRYGSGGGRACEGGRRWRSPGAGTR